MIDKLIIWLMSKIYPVASTDNDLVIPISPLETEAILPVATSSTSKPIITPPTPPTSPTSHFLTFCEAIKEYEGANPKNNNPGNCRCSPVGYLPKYGKVMCNPNNFAVFPTYALGWEYLQALVHQRAVLHPTWTVLDFFANYAPTTDGNVPTAYAAYVAHRVGVIPTTSLKDLFA